MDDSIKVCPFCEVVFALDKIKDHIGKEHLGILPGNTDQKIESNRSESKIEFKCETCAKQFLSSTSLEKHQRFVHPKNISKSVEIVKRKPWKCDQCEKAYFEKRKLKNHIQSIHKGVRHQCGKCEKSFTTKERLKSHTDIIHLGIRISCDECDKSFTMTQTLT